MSTGATLRLFVSHWQFDLTLYVLAGLIAALYLWAVRRAGAAWPLRRTVAFLAGIACVLVALQSGVGAYDDRVLSVHMLQHMLLLMCAPLLLLAGQPILLALRAMHGSQRRAFARGLRRVARFTGPLACLAVFTVVVLGTHIPAVYDATVHSAALHDGEHVLYLLAGLLMWWPILGVDPVPAHRLGGLARLVYLLVVMVPMTLVGAYLDRQPTLVYTPYAGPAHALGINAVIDQAQAGAIMWVIGTTIVTVAGLWALMAALIADEQRQRALEAPLRSGT